LNKEVSRSAMEEVVQRLSYADWLILYYLAQAMDKSNFGSLINKLVDDLPINPYINDDGEIEMEEGKSITPPPGFDEAASEQDPSLSRSTTLKSPNKLKSMLSIGKKVWLIHGFYLFFFYPFLVTICVNKGWEWPT